MIEKGKVSTLHDNKAVLYIPSKDNRVVGPLLIPSHVPTLKENDLVAFCEFDDLSGFIICKLEDTDG